VFFVTMKRTACLAEDVGSTYLWSTSEPLPDYMVSHPRRQYS
jgi:hypothetical protein